MKKYKKPFIIAIVLISIFFIVKSRWVSQSDFELIVFFEYTEVFRVCNNQLQAKQKNPNISFENVDYDDELYYNYYISKYGTEICSDSEKIKRIIEDNYKRHFKNEWKFVF